MSQGNSSAADLAKQNGNGVIPESSHSNFHGTTDLVGTGFSNGQTCPGGSTTIRIAKIREELRMVDEDSFRPLSVRIGPYHEPSMLQPSESSSREEKGKGLMEDEQNKSDRVENPREKKGKELMVNEQNKSDYVDMFLSSILEKKPALYPGSTAAALRGHVLGALKGLEAMKCYDGILTDNKETAFAEMMMRDGIYVFCLLVDIVKPPPARRDEIILLRDVAFLLENQIPWIVLKELLSLAGYSDQPGLLRTRVRRLLANGGYIISRATPELPGTDPAHLLHLVHTYFAPTKPRQTNVNIDGNNGTVPATPEATATRCTGAWKRATVYRKCAYMEIKRREFKDGEVESVLDVSLQGRTLLIPCLRINGDTWTILRNLMALEERMSESPVTTYCAFMSQLARQADDVEFLEYKGIIDNFLGNSEAVVQGFSNLCQRVINNRPSYLYDIWHTLDKRSKSEWNGFMGSFEVRNLGDNVQFVAFIGAVILLLLQIAQVIIGILSLTHKKIV